MTISSGKASTNVFGPSTDAEYAMRDEERIEISQDGTLLKAKAVMSRTSRRTGYGGHEQQPK